MVDTINNKPLRVLTVGSAGPFVIVPLAQLDQIKTVLDANQIGYWVNETAVTLDGQNFTTILDLGRDGDAGKVQAILDTAG